MNYSLNFMFSNHESLRGLWFCQQLTATSAELLLSQGDEENYTSFDRKLSPLAFASGYVLQMPFEIISWRGLSSVFSDDLFELTFQTSVSDRIFKCLHLNAVQWLVSEISTSALSLGPLDPPLCGILALLFDRTHNFSLIH